MAIKTLKPFQENAIKSAMDVFDYVRQMLNAAGNDEQGKATAIHDNGYILIEAPTGAGKTLMAGYIAERLSAIDNVVWFWFAPFKGVVDQSAAFLREQFHGLRLRTLSDDRSAIGTRTGDTFVTTWQLVATRVKDRRSVRQTGEQNASVDELVLTLREQGFRIGVVVDEAHHGFHGETQAAAFFRTVLKPEYTVLVTATPDDRDLQDLEEKMQIGNLHRITVSREDAVGSGPGAGLIKSGVKCIAWRGEEGSDTLVDYETTALREGATLHRFLKSELGRMGVSLTPLMLVQVDSKPKSIEQAKAKLIKLGFTESQIATHTSEEPDAGLLALANDESREVLIFKMAVALGFDAPRAWTLVSMRAAKDEDFGVQLVGRILRVHRRLQGKVLPDALKYGYVLLADIEGQGGLDAAGQRINRLQTAYAAVSPATVILRVGDRNLVQSTGPDGQTTFIPAPPVGAVYIEPPVSVPERGTDWNANQGALFATAWAPEEVRDALRAALATPPRAGRFQYPIRDDVPRRFKTQGFAPDYDITEADCAEKFLASPGLLLDAIAGREKVKVQKFTLEIFTRAYQTEFAFAPPSLDDMRRKAQAELMRCGVLSPKELRRALERRLHMLLAERGVEDADNSEWLGQCLDVLLTQHPELLREAQQRAMAAAAAVYDSGELPQSIDSETPLETSRLNVYRVYPPGLNSWERRFGNYLDADDTESILWWHRNPKQKLWSINALLDSGRGFYPDFVVGVKDRKRLHNGLLADTKHAYDTRAEMPKILAEHGAYGRVLILAPNQSQKWAIAEIDPRSGAARLGRVFRIADAARY